MSSAVAVMTQPQTSWQSIPFSDVPGPIRSCYDSHNVKACTQHADRQDVIVIHMRHSRFSHIWHQSSDLRWTLIPELPPWISN